MNVMHTATHVNIYVRLLDTVQLINAMHKCTNWPPRLRVTRLRFLHHHPDTGIYGSHPSMKSSFYISPRPHPPHIMRCSIYQCSMFKAESCNTFARITCPFFLPVSIQNHIWCWLSWDSFWFAFRIGKQRRLWCYVHWVARGEEVRGYRHRLTVSAFRSKLKLSTNHLHTQTVAKPIWKWRP